MVKTELEEQSTASASCLALNQTLDHVNIRESLNRAIKRQYTALTKPSLPANFKATQLVEAHALIYSNSKE